MNYEINFEYLDSQINSYLQAFFNHLLSFKLAKNTIKNYFNDLKKGMIIISKYHKQEVLTFENLKNLNKTDWREILFQVQKNISVVSVARFFASWRKFSKFLKMQGVDLAILYMQKPKMPSYVLNEKNVKNDLEVFLNYFETEPNSWQNKRDLLLVYLLYSTGVRINEALALTFDDFFKKHIKIVGKGNKIRTVPFFAFLRKIFEEYKQIKQTQTKYVFVNLEGQVLQASAVARQFRNVCLKLNIMHINPHQLRHCLASELLKNGCSLRYIQMLLGHSSLETTKIYLTVSHEDLLENHKNLFN